MRRKAVMYAGESICFGISTPEVDVLARFARVRRSESAALNPTGDLTNAQFPMLNSHLKWDVGLPNVLPHTCGRFPFRMRIENWELNIGQILHHLSNCRGHHVLFRFTRFGLVLALLKMPIKCKEC